MEHKLSMDESLNTKDLFKVNLDLKCFRTTHLVYILRGSNFNYYQQFYLF